VFSRSLFRSWREETRQPLLFSLKQSLFPAVFRFFIKSPRHVCRATLVRKGTYYDIKTEWSLGNTQPIANGYRSCGFGSGAIDKDFAATNGRSGQRAGFKKSRSPQPFVESNSFLVHIPVLV